MLGMKTPSKIYQEAHAAVYTVVRMKGDELVNHALDSRLERESRWSKKSSTICEANKVFQDNINKKVISIPVRESEKTAPY